LSKGSQRDLEHSDIQQRDDLEQDTPQNVTFTRQSANIVSDTEII